MPDMKWYVVRAVSGQERKVKTYLDNEIARNEMEATITQVLICLLYTSDAADE